MAAMWTSLRHAQGRVLVVVAQDDKAARAVAEAHLQTLALGFATVCSPKGISNIRDEFGVVAVFCSDVSKYFAFNYTFIQQCLAKLRPGGFVLARLGGLAESEVDSLETTGLFGGGVNCQIMGKAASAGSRVSVDFSCLKPSWASGAAASLPGAADVIDENALLEDVPAPQGKGKSDCSSAPKACANCSCGRKELEDKVGAEEAKRQLENGKTRSSCGSCYLGDAFRCDGCPYRGLPAFKPGSKVELSSGETETTGQLGMRVEADDVLIGGSLQADDHLPLANGKLMVSVN